MLVTTEGIVLHDIRFGENSIIATIYTREFGRQSYMINAIRSKKNGHRAALLQPLFLVELVTYQKQTREIQRVKELKSHYPYQSIPFDVVKSSQAIFLSEILTKSIREQESYPEMYDFIKNALLYFDLMEKGSAGFHLWFLFRLTEYLGFLPDTAPLASFETWFDLKKGSLVLDQPRHNLYINKEATKYWCSLPALRIQDVSDFMLPSGIRNYLLEKMVDYYQLHFEYPGEIKSLKVLRELFH